MQPHELKKQIQAYRETLAGKSGSIVMFSATGPANLALIDALASTIEQLEKRIVELEKGSKYS